MGKSNMRNKGGNSPSSFIYFKQVNLWKSANASNELGLYLNKVMKSYRYISDDEAGIMIDSRAGMDGLYKERLRRIGILVNDADEVVSRPSPEEQKKYKSSTTARNRNLLAAEKKKRADSQTFFTAMAGNSQQAASPVWSQAQKQDVNRDMFSQLTNPEDDEKGTLPMGFVCGIHEPFYKYKSIPGLKGHTLLIDNSCKEPRAAIFHTKGLKSSWGC